jgi:DNA-binding transcriptional MerR regulator
MKIFGSSDRMSFMNKAAIKANWRIILLCAILLSLFACQKSESSDDYDLLNFSDETTKAAELVADANEDLNKIKILYKKNEDQLEELKTAMSEQNTEKVKAITGNLVGLITDGTILGEAALDKIEKAEAMNTNADFKEYLNLKAQSLQKQLDAFEHRRQAARLLKESFGANDPAAIEKAKVAFKEQEDAAKKTLAVADEYSKKATALAKEVSKRTAN